MRYLERASLLFLSFLAVCTPGTAGKYSEDLSKCLVESADEADRVVLVRWLFSTASLHPAVKTISKIPDRRIDEANQAVSGLVNRLLLSSCRSQAEDALKYEGTDTLETAVQILGQIAVRDLLSSPEVAGAMAGLEKHMDGKSLKNFRIDCSIIQPPVRVSELVPVYTEPARKARIEGRVVLKLLVGEQGGVSAVEVMRGLPMGLTEAAVEAAVDLKFKPAFRICDGMPIRADYMLTVQYKILQPEQ